MWHAVCLCKKDLIGHSVGFDIDLLLAAKTFRFADTIMDKRRLDDGSLDLVAFTIIIIVQRF